MKRLLAAMAVLLCLCLLAGCANKLKSSEKYHEGMPDVDFADEAEVLNGVNIPEFKASDMDESVPENAMRVDLASADKEYRITSGGTYVLSGALNDGRVIVDSMDAVHIVLNGAAIACKGGSALYCKNADRLIITLAEGTENFISDSEEYFLDSGDENEPNAAIFSQSDLTINGKGRLTVTAKHNNGINSRDKLKLYSGDIEVISSDDGIVGKDCLLIGGGNISVTSGDDALRSTNSKDEERGSIVIRGGSIGIDAKGEALNAKNCIVIDGGVINAKCGGGANEVEFILQNDGKLTNEQAQQNSDSCKGLSAKRGIVIRGGVLELDTFDDSIHSNGSTVISGGEFNIKSGDEGIHSDAFTVINGGVFRIERCFEGIQGANVRISGGVLDIASADDGINSTGSTEEPADAENKDGLVKIEGGVISVCANGDGVDSNNAIWIVGGVLSISNANSSTDTPFDCEGVFAIDGGSVFGCGGSERLVTASGDSGQYSAFVVIDGKAGDEITVKNASGVVLFEQTAGFDFSCVAFSSADMKQGASYTVFINGAESVTFELTSVRTVKGEF